MAPEVLAVQEELQAGQEDHQGEPDPAIQAPTQVGPAVETMVAIVVGAAVGIQDRVQARAEPHPGPAHSLHHHRQQAHCST